MDRHNLNQKETDKELVARAIVDHMNKHKFGFTAMDKAEVANKVYHHFVKNLRIDEYAQLLGFAIEDKS